MTNGGLTDPRMSRHNVCCQASDSFENPVLDPTLAPVHVLAVDDDPSVRQMIADYLGDNDIRVSVTGTGRDIAQVMARDTIDLVILDLKLPGEDGMHIARELRAE